MPPFASTRLRGESRTLAPPLELPREQPWLYGPVGGILLGNAITLAGAVVQHWPALPVMMVYWGQSVAIGVVNVIRMARLKDFSTEGFRSNGRPVPATAASARSTAAFFAMHYGIFHLVYAVFLFQGGLGALTAGTLVAVAVNVAMFAFSHAWGLVRAGGQEYRRKPNLGTLMFYPYLRVLPMHLAIIFGAGAPSGALPLFILLKTGSDLALHQIERRIFRTVE